MKVAGAAGGGRRAGRLWRGLTGIEKIGVTAGASAPSDLVDELLETLEALGGIEVKEEIVVTEAVHFALPAQVR